MNDSITVPAAPPDAYQAYRARRVFGSLDGLRALSILAVIWHHGIDLGSPFVQRHRALHFGFLGVDLFFVLSGFLIVTLLLRERDRTGTISLPNFYARRALRIFPLYYAVILAFGLLFLGRADARALEFRADLPYLLTYTTNWHHASGMFAITWSLAAEEQFYLLWPPIERFVRKYWLPILTALLLASQVVHFGLIDGALERSFGWRSDEPFMLRETTFTPICLGVLLAHALHHRRSFEATARVLGHPLAAPLALLVLVALPFLLPADIRGSGRLTVHLVMLLVVASAVVREDHALARFYTWPPLARIGAISYGLYLLHHIGLAIAEKGLARAGVHDQFARLALGAAISYGLASLSFRYFETPFLRLKRKYA